MQELCAHLEEELSALASQSALVRERMAQLASGPAAQASPALLGAPPRITNEAADAEASPSYRPLGVPPPQLLEDGALESRDLGESDGCCADKGEEYVPGEDLAKWYDQRCRDYRLLRGQVSLCEFHNMCEKLLPGHDDLHPTLEQDCRGYSPKMIRSQI